VFALADRITVMNEGRVLIEGNAEEVRGSETVQQVYIGSGVSALAARARTHAGSAGSVLLALDRVDTFYGKSHIVRGASLSVREREIVALLGRNGAGKSTLLKTIVGIARAGGGRITFGDSDLTALPAAQSARLGVGYVPQGRGLFAGMSVRANLELGRLKRSAGTGAVWSEDKILQFFPRLKNRLDTPADFLSGGEQQMVAVARALSGHVRVLLLDEPFEGLAPAVVEELFEAFDRLRGEVAMVIVEHNLDLVLALADRAYVLERGSVVHEGPAAALRENIELRRRVLWM
jgi:ABC-type branched-subunit amino acid transport system ATPase component